jgi:hypothetical protein
MKSSFNGIIPLLLYSAAAKPIQFQAHIPAGWRSDTLLVTLDHFSVLPNTFL